MSEAQALETGTPEGGEQQTTIAGGDIDGEIQAPQSWPDDWRTLVAGNDEKELARLERLSSPQDIWKKYRSMESEYSKRQPRLEYVDDMPEDKLAEWRKQEGIPESPDKYSLEFDNGLVVGESDKEFVDNFLAHAHSKNIPESHVKESLAWYLDNQAKQQEVLQQRNAEYRYENLAKLKSELGGEFQGSINAIKELFVDHPEVEDLLLGAFDSEGLQIGNNEQLIRWAIDTAKKVNPSATLTFPGGESGIKGGETRLAELKQIMTSDFDTWHKSPHLQKEMDEINDKLSAAKR